MSKEYFEALDNLKTALHNEWLRFYPQLKELDEKTKFVDGVRMVSGDAEAFLTVKQALQRLDSIDNSNPSEALECLDGIEYVADVLKVNHKIGSRDIANQEIKEMAVRLYYRIPTIKQALLKAQFLEEEYNNLMEDKDNLESELFKQSEPKHYLKWEDLEKFKDKDSVKVKMNDTELSLIIQIDCLNDIYVQLYKEKEDGNCVNLLSDFFRNKELFNDLRLELLE